MIDANHSDVLLIRFESQQHPKHSQGKLVSLWREDPALVVVLSQEIDDINDSDRRIVDAVLRLLDLHPHLPVIVDLTGSTFLNTCRLSLILKLEAAARSKNRLRIVITESNLIDVIRRCGLQSHLRVFDSIELAASSIDL